jgi:nitrogenase molybdenum-iron protein beta chain
MIGSQLKDKETGEIILIDPHFNMCECVGVGRALYGMQDVLRLVHAPIGCQWNVATTSIFQAGNVPKFATTDLGEDDVVFGGERKLKKALLKGDKVFDVKYIVVVSGCVPELIGDDLEGVVSEVQGRVSAKIIPIHVAGFKGDHHDGYRKMLKLLIDNFMQEEKEKIPRSVNLVGVMADEYRAVGDVKEIERILSEAGIKLNCVLMGGQKSIEEIKVAPKAALNVVWSKVDGLEAAKYMEEKFGIPYITPPPPYGIEGTNEWLLEVAQFFGLDKKAREAAKEEEDRVYDHMKPTPWGFQVLPGMPFLIIAHPTAAAGITKFFTKELSFMPYAIVSSGGELAEEMINKVVEELEPEFPPTIMVDPGYYDVKNLILGSLDFLEGLGLGSATPIYMGSSHDKLLIDQEFLRNPRKMLIPFVRVSYPTYDAPTLVDTPYMGYNGALYLIQDFLTEGLKLSYPLNAWRNPWA